MRASLIATAIVLLSAAPSNAMDCMGSGLGEVCVDPFTGEIWSAADDYVRQSDDRTKSGSYGISKYPNATAGSRSEAPPASSTGITTVLQPAAQSGNAEVLAPQDNNGGAVVLESDDSGPAADCGSGTSC